MNKYFFLILLFIPAIAFSQLHESTKKESKKNIKKEKEYTAFMVPGWYITAQFSPFSYTLSKTYGPEVETWLEYVTSRWYQLDDFGMYSNQLEDK